MGFFKRLSSLFASPGKPEDSAYWLVVQCNRCGEIIRSRVDLRNELSINYGDEDGNSGETTYFCRKLIIGDQQCFQQIEVELSFDANRQLIDRKIKGGQFVEE